MVLPKKYLRDRLVLLLLSINAFLTLLAALSVLFRLESGGTAGLIVQYRANLGISAFKTGSESSMWGFVLFALLIAVLHTVLSIRTYRIRRQLSLLILALGGLLLLLCSMVANALLALH